MVDHLSDVQKLDLALEGVNQVEYGHGRSLQDAIEDEYGVRLDSRTTKALEVMDMRLPVADFGQDVENLKKKDDPDHRKDDTMKVYEIVREARSSGGNVYMGATLNQKKARIAWGLGRDDYTVEETDNFVVELPDKSWYGRFEEAFGWKKLKDISLRSITDYKDDIAESTYNDLLEEMGIEDFDGDEEAMEEAQSRSGPTPPEEEKLNVSLSQKRTEQDKFFAKEIKERFEDGESLTLQNKKKKRRGWTSRYRTVKYDVNTLIMSPSNAERNISNYYWIAGDDYGDGGVALANCNVSTYEYLEDVPGIYHIDDYAEEAWRKPIESSEGIVTVAEVRNSLVLHLVEDGAQDALLDVVDEIPETLEELYENDIGWYETRNWSGPDYDEMVYAPVTMDELFELLPAVGEADIEVIWGDRKPDMVNKWQRTSIKKDVWLYARARLDGWDPASIEMERVMSRDFDHKLANGGYELVENLAYRHDKGEPPVSQA